MSQTLAIIILISAIISLIYLIYRKKHPKKKMYVMYAINFLLAFSFMSCSNYSEGERTGTITKFSRKGAYYKTWEGELLMGGLREKMNTNGTSSSVANIFEFSIDGDVNDSKIIEQIKNSLSTGARVTLIYHQELMTNCSGSRGETGYYIDRVEEAP